jgi:long-chain fatty acid transport protein
VGADLSYTNPAGARFTGDLGQNFVFPPPSNVYITANLQDLGVASLGPLTVGLGLVTPYGLAVRYPDPTPFSTVVTRSKLPTLDIKPTLAYRLTDWLSMGVGADIYTFASFIGSGGYQQQSLTPDGAKVEVNANGTMAAYNASVLITPLSAADGKPRLNLGFVFKSGGNFPLSGDYKINGYSVAKVKTALDLPDIYTAAVAYWPIRDREHEWKLEYDMDFVRWNSFQTFDMQLSNGITSRTLENWKGIYTISVGTEFKWLNPHFSPGWNVALRAGYNHSETPIPDYTYTPAVPENRWNGFALGLGLSCHKGGIFLGLFECGQSSGLRPSTIGVDFAFQTAFMEPRNVTTNLKPQVLGAYEGTIYIGSMNINVGY